MPVESDFNLLPLIMRWLHIASATVVIGSFTFYVFVVIPVFKKHLSDEERAKLYEPLMRKWKLLIHPPILLFLISGFYTFIAVTRFEHEGQGLYHALFGIKFLLALCFFTLAIVMTSTMKWSEKLRERRGLWWALMGTLIAIVLIAGYLHVMPTTESTL